MKDFAYFTWEHDKRGQPVVTGHDGKIETSMERWLYARRVQHEWTLRQIDREMIRQGVEV